MLISLNLLFLSILADYFDSTREPLKGGIYIYFMPLKQALQPTAYATSQIQVLPLPVDVTGNLKLNYLLSLPAIGLKEVKFWLNTMFWIKTREHHSSQGVPDLCSTTWKSKDSTQNHEVQEENSYCRELAT